MKNERPMPIANDKGKTKENPNHRPPPDPPTNNPHEPFPTQIPSIASVAPPGYRGPTDTPCPLASCYRYPVSVVDMPHQALLPTQSPDPLPTLNAIRSIASDILGGASAQTPGVPETSVAAGSEMPAARKHPRVSRCESMTVNLSPARSFVGGVQCRLSPGPVTWPLATSQPKLLRPWWTQGLHRIEPWPRGIGNTPPATPEGETDGYYQKEWTWSEEPQDKEWTWSEEPQVNEWMEGEDVVRGATEGEERVEVALGPLVVFWGAEREDVVRGATGEREEGRGIEEREDVVRGATEGEERVEVALGPLVVFWGAEREDVVRGATGERATGTGREERVEVGCLSSNLFRNDAPGEREEEEGMDVALATGEREAGEGMEERETGVGMEEREDVVRGATEEGVDKYLLVRKYLGAVGAGTPEREDVLTMVGTDGAERTEGRAGSF
ncbi:hypothetical protein ASPNIDRAFT_40936 [Aspergillus niger ATCC 1015]|uniref:Uncharacterized protein n=1 Tax=Aspergillus niger (strain ATCC 1015 / CBS 113.46 / FGSC A1144 / LSHB Ac4 / NCTC 3858a / NRRL 328 / USDA 3528.7) TaxID=380704 RepID=G3Y6C4_ASPNA|nr:hypothetical protein ASPNIDRAFT_40936 [Aspergillus niger ATCC 1015]